MTKILLVEDDKSLREIYGVRLLAEGYDIVSAGDGEEALAMAIKERPVLIVTDVMMPRISGFDMLDILRSTTETKNIKVIMMTALSSEDQRRHGEMLGADRYLVKSQVGIEDVVRVVHEVLGDAPSTSAVAPAPTVTNMPTPQPTPATPQAQPASTVQVGAPRPMASVQPRAVQDPMVTQHPPVIPQRPLQPLAPRQNVAQPASAVHNTMPPAYSTMPSAPSSRPRVIRPLNDPATKIDINSLLDKELAREAASTAEEKAAAANQLKNAENTIVAATSAPVIPAPTPAPQPQSMPPMNPAASTATPRPPVQAPQRIQVQPVETPHPSTQSAQIPQQGYNSQNNG